MRLVRLLIALACLAAGIAIGVTDQRVAFSIAFGQSRSAG